MTPEEISSLLNTPFRFGSKMVRGRFVIPSGIRCTRASTIEWCFANVDPVGVVTTKSVCLNPRAGYFEPIYARYAQDSYINAVGLSNPGAEQFRREVEQIHIPDDKFLLVSIFGGNMKDFVDTAEVLRPIADGFELNMSCPHAEGYGVEIGQKPELVAEITAAVAAATGLPVIVKLSAVVGDVGYTAKRAMAAGAAGVTVSNTIGPATVNVGNVPILSNKIGGLSGVAIRPLALRAVKRVREAIGEGPVLIGMGGIFTADDVQEFAAAGSDLIGIGSALTGMDSEEMTAYFESLQEAFSGAPSKVCPSESVQEIGMGYTPAKVVGRQDYHAGLFKLVLDHLPIRGKPGELAGKYFFLCIPGVGEKPFAIFSAEEKSIIVRVAGRFTKHLQTLRAGSPLYLRGPYGRAFPNYEKRTAVMIGGGTGIASLYEIGKRLEGHSDMVFLLGGRSSKDLFDLPRFEELGQVQVATDDGSMGRQGFVTQLLKEQLDNPDARNSKGPIYIACGPEPMIEASFKLMRPSVPAEDIWGAVEYMTSCGVGICGKCASPSGLLTCIDGPFLQVEAFERPKHCQAEVKA